MPLRIFFPGYRLIDPSQKITLKIKSSIPTYNVEMDISAQSPPLINEIDRDIVFSEINANKPTIQEIQCVEDQVENDESGTEDQNEVLEVTRVYLLRKTELH